MNLFRAVVRVSVIGGLLAAADVAFTPTRTRPALDRLLTRNPETTGFMRHAAAAGHPVRDWTWVGLDSIAPVAVCAVMAAEDPTFFDHGALDWEAQRALARDLVHLDFSRGYSDIPQQLARNLFLSPSRTVSRKAKEYLLAFELTHAVPKDRQLELYLNVAEWGDGVWGIEAASRHYFGVPSSALTPAQSVVLATMLVAPRRERTYMLGARVVPRHEMVSRKLWASRLLSTQEYGALVDRLRIWREYARTHDDDIRSGFVYAASIMGPESFALVASHEPTARLPLARYCNLSRRGYW